MVVVLERGLRGVLRFIGVGIVSIGWLVREGHVANGGADGGFARGRGDECGLTVGVEVPRECYRGRFTNASGVIRCTTRLFKAGGWALLLLSSGCGERGRVSVSRESNRPTIATK
jgi:hypothetical protein